MADEVGLECEEALNDGRDEAMQFLRASQLVKLKDVQPLRDADGSGWYATLWCRAVHSNRPCEQRQFSKTRTTDD